MYYTIHNVYCSVNDEEYDYYIEFNLFGKTPSPHPLSPTTSPQPPSPPDFFFCGAGSGSTQKCKKLKKYLKRSKPYRNLFSSNLFIFFLQVKAEQNYQ